MKFQIAKLVIWPRDEAFPPREVSFELGKVNVITGASRTGKSAIIPIIDYCLGSSDCHIPIDTIRTYAAWYGIIVATATGQMLLARRVPTGRNVSDDFYYLEAQQLSVPVKIDRPNETLSGVKLRLNTLANTPSFKLNEEDQGYTGRLSFRDLMALVFQSQDIVANQNVLFYKTHAHEHRERLRNWFPYILGAETLDILKARNRLKALDSELRRLQREYEALSAVSSAWQQNLMGHLHMAAEYGLLDEPVPEKAGIQKLVSLARNALAGVSDVSKADADSIVRANTEVARLEGEEEELDFRIGGLKKRMSDLKRLKDGFRDYGGTVVKRMERLHLSKWLLDLSSDATSCPVCGSTEHPKASGEVAQICEALSQEEARVRSISDVPITLVREEVRLQEELSALIESRKALQERYDLVIARDREAQKEVHRRRDMHMFIGHLKASLEMFDRLADGSDMQQRIAALEKEKSLLVDMISQEGVQKRIAAATARISQGALEQLKTLDVEEKYRAVAPRFDIKELSISVLSDDGDWHFLAEVGSASNWVSFHLALMCALQEYFLEQPDTVIPSFLVFDQPSQVYFPRVSRANGDADDDPEYEHDEDVEAVRMIFQSVAKSVENSGGGWQAIILDHADSSIYGQVPGVHEVEEWRGSVKLIPEAWYCDL